MTILVNAAAGNRTAGTSIAAVETQLPDALIMRVDDPDDLVASLKAAALSSQALGVMGGDGTVSAAAAVATREHVPLAVFPCGTFNHFARDAGLDDIDSTIDAVRRGQVVDVDTAVIDGRTFVNTASMGAYSRFVEVRERHEDRIGKWAAAAVALTRVIREGQPIEVTIDGANRRVWAIFIGNCSYEPPGSTPSSRPSLRDGQLDIRIADASQSFARLRLIASLARRNLTSSPVYTRRLAHRMDIATNSSSVLLAADGEIFDGHSTFCVVKLRRSLAIYAPSTGST